MESAGRSLLISCVPAGHTRAAGGMVLLCTRTGWCNGSNEENAAVPVGGPRVLFQGTAANFRFFTAMFK